MPDFVPWTSRSMSPPPVILHSKFKGRKISDRPKYLLETEMPKATWAGKVIADSNHCVVVEGNQYFPADAVKKDLLKPSKHTSECPWKGTAHYYHLQVNGMQNENTSWH